MMQMWMIWVIIGVILVIVEMVTLTFYVLWLGIGAFVAAVVTLIFPDAVFAQVIAGAITVILLTMYTKPLTRRMRQSKGFKDAVDGMVGKEGEVVESIDPPNMGIVKVGSDQWSASADEPIETGAQVVIKHRSSTILTVQKLKGD